MTRPKTIGQFLQEAAADVDREALPPGTVQQLQQAMAQLASECSSPVPYLDPDTGQIRPSAHFDDNFIVLLKDVVYRRNGGDESDPTAVLLENLLQQPEVV